ncbi:hypothetical protein QGM71_16910 [Virgibacillus sp. C22-A2]|uniref:Uncharacterized protein n=1 Tax=Virgibacillus tibetensis TaxID=3042313 RepID=A0ABU6KJY1_9BACI|nr:hypothetical protein [Virgibacillus sp. C22-A2]
MDIKDFTWDSDSIRWNHKGRNIALNLQDINFANLEVNQKHIYVVCGKDFSENQIYYLSYEGKKIFEYNKKLGGISWEHNGEIIDINCDYIENARLYVEEEVVMVITRTRQGNGKLLGFKLNGMLLFEQVVPEEYQLLYLSSINNRPSVVTEGSKKHADSYGRNTWHCMIDIKTGKLSKANLAY